jgi:putative oxidoreductase
MNMSLSKGLSITSWTLQLIAAVILFQTLFFKFSGAKESIDIFSTVGMEPWGRIGSDVVELVASILLVIPATVTLGAIISLVTISGAIFFHLTKLGIALPAVNDRGELFALAVVVFVVSLAVLSSTGLKYRLSAAGCDASDRTQCSDSAFSIDYERESALIVSRIRSPTLHFFHSID